MNFSENPDVWVCRAIMRVSPEWLVHWISPGVCGPYRIIGGYRDAKILDVRFNLAHDYIEIVFDSPDLPPIPKGGLLPLVGVTLERIPADPCPE